MHRRNVNLSRTTTTHSRRLSVLLALSASASALPVFSPSWLLSRLLRKGAVRTYLTWPNAADHQHTPSIYLQKHRQRLVISLCQTQHSINRNQIHLQKHRQRLVGLQGFNDSCACLVAKLILVKPAKHIQKVSWVNDPAKQSLMITNRKQT